MFTSKQICPIKARKDILAFMVAIEQEGQLFTIPLQSAHALGSISNLSSISITNDIFYKYDVKYSYIPRIGTTLFTDLYSVQIFIEDQTSFCRRCNITPPIYKILRCYIPKNTLYFKSADGKRYRPEKLIVEKIVNIPDILTLSPQYLLIFSILSE